MNAIYECAVAHSRLKPKKYSFNYNVFMLSVDLAELPSLAKRIPWLSHNGWNLFSINDVDHVNVGNVGGIRANLLDWLSSKDVQIPADVKTTLLTFPRVFGYGFNPVSFYFIESAEGQPLCAIAEVVNTFREMKLYALEELDDNGIWHSRMAKDFYVSPFSDPGHSFDFRIGIPGAKWRVNIDDYDHDERMLISSIRGTQCELSSGRLMWFAIKYPMLSLKIIGMIHWHALRLWIMKVPFLRKTERREAQLDVIRPHKTLKTNKP
jgi:DUF1365 family protein